ncbi:sugar-binding protein [Clostridium sp. W14A]|uniref:Sugar-binding transcriptional regulator n=1 Tax=Caproicibacter fermentans TaxID=2576756 RepID=A0A7G8T6L4_9FIRM|nr:sugar-binding transcriptional regulator [Caproicibacter fermentans]OCN02221.1 sugar-binding protein [Clostridium sp. W14A]QNK39255.1 sugar-binding transcriptional regulator [Caproicibacter fermentans]
MDYEEILAVKTAWYYYMENMTQQQISEKLGVSRIRVMKILEKAKKDGIIQFKIRQDGEQHMQVERQLADKWGLKDTFVVPTPHMGENLNETIAKAAAMYISHRISENCFINMGYGDTLSKILNHLATMNEFTVSVVSLTGGVSYYLPNAQSHTFNAKLYLIPTPLLVSSKEMVSAMREEPSVREIFRMVRLASMTLVGIGGMGDDATVLENGILSKNDFLYLSMKGAVGDVLSHFIDKDGVPVQTHVEDRLISTSLKTLRELDNVVGVAAGASKVDAIRAALRGKYIDILITDEETALRLIEEDNSV